MTLMVNGKKVLGYAIGGNEFYSLDNFKVSVPFKCDYSYDYSYNDFSFSVIVRLYQSLNPGSAFTLRYLIDKGEKIKLIVTFHNDYTGTAHTLESDTIDLSKPDSNGHFNFNFQEGVNNSPAIDAYCYYKTSDSTFRVYSYTLGKYENKYDVNDSGYMNILYLD